MKDEARDSRPKTLDSGLLGVFVTEMPTVISTEFARQFNVSHITVSRQLKRMGKIQHSENGSHFPNAETIPSDTIFEQDCHR